MTELTLSIVSHGHGSQLARLLSDLEEQPSLAGTRVIVTLNLRDESLDVTRYSNLDLVLLRNKVPKGFGANHNAAFKACRTPWFGVLNPDLRLVGTEPFTALLATATLLDDVAAIAPRIISPSGTPEDAVRENLTPWSLVKRYIGRRREPLETDVPARRGASFYWLGGMCLLLRAELFRTIGGFDERFFLYCEDYDLCARLYAAGYALVVDRRAHIMHEGQRHSHRSTRHLKWHISSLLKVWCSRAFWAVTFG